MSEIKLNDDFIVFSESAIWSCDRNNGRQRKALRGAVDKRPNRSLKTPLSLSRIFDDFTSSDRFFIVCVNDRKIHMQSDGIVVPCKRFFPRNFAIHIVLQSIQSDFPRNNERDASFRKNTMTYQHAPKASKTVSSVCCFSSSRTETENFTARLLLGECPQHVPSC